MTLDATLSLDVVIAILVIFVAVWRLDGKIGELRSELRGDIVELRRENVETRNELKGDIQRLETRIDRLEKRLTTATSGWRDSKAASKAARSGLSPQARPIPPRKGTWPCGAATVSQEA